MESILFFLVSFPSSVIGAICGIGGGVIIKPMLDLFQLADVAVASFLSGCTVLSMSSYSVARNMLSGENKLELKTSTPLALGAVFGGILGRQLFELIRLQFENPDMTGRVQSICLGIMTLATFTYTLNKGKIRSLQVSGTFFCGIIGLGLGLLSSFLGIGGGPINLMVMFCFFGMDTKTAAQNSLYVIFFSQTASLITSFVTHSVPEFEITALLLMITGGISGGIAGRIFHRKLSEDAVNRLFLVLMGIIVCICIFNAFSF